MIRRKTFISWQKENSWLPGVNKSKFQFKKLNTKEFSLDKITNVCPDFLFKTSWHHPITISFEKYR